MTDKPFRTAWANRDAFAEVAEALKIPTDQIVSMLNVHGNIMVMYCPEPYNEAKPREQEIWAAVFKRDADEILFLVANRKSDLTWAEIEAKIEEGMREKFGEEGA